MGCKRRGFNITSLPRKKARFNLKSAKLGAWRAAMDHVDTTTITTSSSTSHLTKMQNAFPILLDFVGPSSQGGGSSDKTLSVHGR